MKAIYERTGGFAGIRLRLQVDTADLQQEDTRRFQQLVEGADFFNLPANMIPSKPPPDRFQYTVTIEDEERKHTVALSEATLPVNVRPLTDWLAKMGHR